MKGLMVAGLSVAVTLAVVIPSSALFIFHPAISAAVWGPHYVAYPPAVAVPAVTYPAAVNYPAVVAPAAPLAVVIQPVGSYVRTLPAACVSLTVNLVTYFRCGAVYYKPTFIGTTLMYEVVNNPG